MLVVRAILAHRIVTEATRARKSALAVAVLEEIFDNFFILNEKLLIFGNFCDFQHTTMR